MYDNLLPIGSVVLLKGEQKRVMICGRIQAKSGDETIYDYSACLYPEGLLNSSEIIFFNQESIDTIFFIGFQDREEILFRMNVLRNLGELEIKNGAIVPKA